MTIAWVVQPNGALLWSGGEYMAEVRQKGDVWRWCVWHVWSERKPDPDPEASGERASCAEAQRAALHRITGVCLTTMIEAGWEFHASQDVVSGDRNVHFYKRGERCAE